MSKSKNIGVNLTRKCNMKCSWCYYQNLYYIGNSNADIPYDKNYDADFNMLKEKLSAVKIKNIYLTGGEPTTYPYLNEIIQWLRDRIEEDIFLCTNAKVISEDTINQLRTNRVKLLLSIKDGGLRTHNFLSHLREQGVSMHIYHVLTTKSISILKNFVQKFGWVERVRLLYETSSNSEKECITYEDWFGLLNIANYYLKPIGEKVEVEVGFLPDFHELSKAEDRGAVKRHILDFDGKVYPCPLLVERNDGSQDLESDYNCSVKDCPVLCNAKNASGFTAICPFRVAILPDFVNYINSIVKLRSLD